MFKKNFSGHNKILGVARRV